MTPNAVMDTHAAVWYLNAGPWIPEFGNSHDLVAGGMPPSVAKTPVVPIATPTRRLDR